MPPFLISSVFALIVIASLTAHVFGSTTLHFDSSIVASSVLVEMILPLPFSASHSILSRSLGTSIVIGAAALVTDSSFSANSVIVLPSIVQTAADAALAQRATITNALASRRRLKAIVLRLWLMNPRFVARCQTSFSYNQKFASSCDEVFFAHCERSPGATAVPASSIYDCGLMPLYEFECPDCGRRFEELAPSETRSLVCPGCGSERTRRLISPVSPPGRQPRGAGVRSDELRRGEREAARGERLAETKRKRAAGEPPGPRRGGGGA